MTGNWSRPVVTRPGSEFTVTIGDALERYARAGLLRTPERYCAKGQFNAV